ncbi:thermonuclease family protein [Pseudomonas sp. RIT-PI-AD]|uniref:thermonuclease family protein n=1 Tax=Pseudomonas sp. RIT-PI-AD TaxID=3035294 RepID=UPI0021D95562|nr:thermonuclease family protein [Pseudomonas sp. RIT-PI-AD]
MRLFFLMFFMAICAPTLARDDTYGQVVVDEITSIYDGDTFRATIRGWPPVVGLRVPVRLYGIDTPEMRDNRPRVRELARLAKQFSVARLRGAKRIELRNIRRDKYFRLLAEVWVDGQSLGGLLLKAGLAKPYDGGTKSPW